MKTRLLLAIAFSLGGFFAQAQVPEADALVRQAATYLKNNDSTSYLTLFPDFEHMKLLMTELAASATDSATRKGVTQQTQQMTEDMYRNIVVRNVLTTFHKIYDDGQRAGLNWSSATLETFGYEQDPTPFDSTKILKGDIFLKDGTKRFKLSFNNIMWRQSLHQCLGIEFEGIKSMDASKPAAPKPATSTKKPTPHAAHPAAKKPVKKVVKKA